MKASALRATTRIAWRGGRRHPLRSSLIFVMIGLPVALVSLGATVARTAAITPQEEIAGMMGQADLVVQSPDRSQVARLKRNLPEGSEILTIVGEDFFPVVQNGQLVNVTLVELDRGLDIPLLRGHYEVRSGRAPLTAGEVAVHEDLLEGSNSTVGDEIDLGGYELEVVGTARHPFALDRALAVVGPGTMGAKTPISKVLVGLPAGVDVDRVEQFVQSISLDRGEVGAVAAGNAQAGETVSFIGGVLALFATGLIAAAAFVVGARRQLRELGILGAAGGEPEHARAVVLLTGTTLGLAGATMGCALGVGLAYVFRPFLDDVVGRAVGSVEVNPLVLLGAVSIGTLASTVASFGPARSVAKLSVVEALAGRSAQPRPPGRVAAVGGSLLLGGGIVTAWATASDSEVVLAAGLIAMLLGVLLAIPMLIAAVGKVASRLPLSPRLAARDAARHGRRTGAAVAAAVIAFGIPVAVGSWSASEEVYERQRPRLRDDQLYFGTVDGVPAVDPEGLVADLESAFPEAVVVPLRNAVVPAKRPEADGLAAFALGATDPATPNTLYGWELFVGDGDLLRALHANGGEDALAEGKAVVLGGFGIDKSGMVRVERPSRPGRAREVPAVSISSPSYFFESIPRVVISEETAAQLGLALEEPSDYLLTATSSVSSQDVERARAIAADHPGFHVQDAEALLPEDYGRTRAVVLALSIPLALAILAVAVALVVSESRRSHQILSAVGAGPMTHRKVVASTSALLASIAAVSAVPAAICPTFVVQASSAGGRSLVIPWVTIAIVVLLAPLLSGALAGIVSRSPRLGSLLTPST